MNATTNPVRVVVQPKWSVLSNSGRTDPHTEILILKRYVESLDDIILLLFLSLSVRPSLIYFTKVLTSLLTLFFFLNDIAVDDVSHGNERFLSYLQKRSFALFIAAWHGKDECVEVMLRNMSKDDVAAQKTVRSIIHETSNIVLFDLYV